MNDAKKHLVEKPRASRPRLEKLNPEKPTRKELQEQVQPVAGGKEETLRNTGIDILGNVRWGTHFCLFYHTKEDLTDILVPYFKAGLENNEFCMWVTSEPLSEKEAEKAARKTVPNFDGYLKTGQIEIVPHNKWYLKDGSFDLRRVLNAWIDKLDWAFARGYDGIRVTGNTSWLEKKDWKKFADYEAEVNNAIGKYRMLAICTYCLDKCAAPKVIDVVSSHQFALIRQEGDWRIIESSEHKRTEKMLRAKTHEIGERIKEQNCLYGISRLVENPSISLEKLVQGIIALILPAWRYPQITCARIILEGQESKSGNFRDTDWKQTADIVVQGEKVGRIEVCYLEERPVKDEGPFSREERNLIDAIAERLGRIIERTRAEERLSKYQEQLRLMTSKLSLAEERQRRHLATELHDRIGQDLALSMLKLDVLQKSALSEDIAALVNEIGGLTQKAIQDTRTLTFDLSSPTLYRFGFVRAIEEWLMEQGQERHGIKTKFADDGQPKPLDEDIGVLLFQATRELLINVVKHAQAHLVKVSTQRIDEQIETIVENDGVGFDVSEVGSFVHEKGGFGLFNIQERLKHVGGRFKIESEPGTGTRVTLVAPLKTEKGH